MTEQITLEEALELVTFCQELDGTWAVAVVKGDCGSVEGDCNFVEGDCNFVEGDCGTVKGDCGTVEGFCDFVEGDCGTVKGNCGTVGGKVLNTINGREWQYIETPRQKLQRLQELIDAFNQLENNQ